MYGRRLKSLLGFGRDHGFMLLAVIDPQHARLWVLARLSCYVGFGALELLERFRRRARRARPMR